MTIITGLFRLLTDATVKVTPKGDSVTELFMAYSYGMKKDGEKYKPSQTINASLWGKRGESLAPYLLKSGQVFAVIEDPHVEEYDGKNGKGYKLTGRVLTIEFAGGKNDSNGESEPQAQAQPAARPRTPLKPPSDFDDDIPF